MSIKAAFNMVLQLHGRSMTITRYATPTNITGTIRATPSNYFRNMEVAEKITSEGREFVISKDSLDAIAFPVLKKGDRLIDTDLGNMTINEIREMFDIGGNIIGFRVRVG